MEKKRQEIIIFILTIAIAFFIGLISVRFFFRVDLTSSRTYTISKVSKNLFTEIPEEAHLIYVISDKLKKLSPFPEQVEDMLYEYAAFSRGKIKVSVVDPVKEGITTQVESLGVLPQQIEVIEQNEQSLATVYTGIIIEYLDNQKALPLVFRTETLEYELTSAVRDIVKGGEKTLGVLVGDDGRSMEQDYSMLQQQFQGSFGLKTIRRGEPIPDEITALLILGGKDISLDDLKALDDYIGRGGQTLFCVDSIYVDLNQGMTALALPELPVLDLLKKYGVTVQEKLVIDKYNKRFRIPTEVFGQIAWQILGPYPYWIAVSGENVSRDNPITARFQGLDLLWPAQLTATDVEGVKRDTIIKSSKEAYLLADNFDLNPMQAEMLFYAAGDTKGQYDLAYSLEGRFPGYFDSSKKNRETRMMIISSSMFPTNLIQYSDSNYNMGFLQNAAQWLLSDDDLLTIKTRSVRDTRLNRIQDPQGKMRAFLTSQLVNLVLVPIVIIAFGLNRFLKRRKKQSLNVKREA